MIKIDENEIRLWILNDEPLYLHYKNSQIEDIYEFIKRNKRFLIKYIKNKLGE